jgi:hypothetical protein
LADIPKFECDYKDMEEDNIDMEEVLTYRKRPYRCVETRNNRYRKWQ